MKYVRRYSKKYEHAVKQSALLKAKVEDLIARRDKAAASYNFNEAKMYQDILENNFLALWKSSQKDADDW